jgi:hypothetical protein
LATRTSAEYLYGRYAVLYVYDDDYEEYNNSECGTHKQAIYNASKGNFDLIFALLIINILYIFVLLIKKYKGI